MASEDQVADDDDDDDKEQKLLWLLEHLVLDPACEEEELVGRDLEKCKPII